ncbi:hypothetical protein C8R47DRAFT_666754 [Mycena vitilis]|nr:hypothetical protein C8R47DRAFT_666754 [Mycena vitilis]
MRQAAFTSVALAIWTQFSEAAQVPLRAPSSVFATPPKDSWDLNDTPNINATGHLVFDTVSSFLQHWPNTRYRNGHNIVPGMVPAGTLLYHGRSDAKLPSGPDWIGTDPEHSFLFCRGSAETDLTLITSRPLQVLYFDGSSAAKMKDGPMDTQDVVGWGQVCPDRFFDERQRILDLCAWGRPFGIDGYVRMEMDFEIMLCDFTAGVDIVAMANLALNGRGGPPRPGGPGRRPQETFTETNNSLSDGPFAATSSSLEVINSGSWHNRYPGDRRIKLDLTRLVSFYDTSLVPSLVAKRFDIERWDHRLLGITSEDIAAVMARLTEAYTAPLPPGSGVDWDTLYKVIVDRYADRLEMVQYVLNATLDDALVVAKNAIKQFRVMLTPYTLHGVVPKSGAGNAWAAPVYEFCATSHTEYMRRSAHLSDKFTASETLLLNAVEETNREICRVVVALWAEGVAAGLDDELSVEDPIEHDGTALVRKWMTAVDNLMAWLDWSVWIKCRPECSFEEICYLPTWPFAGPGGPGRDRRERPPSEGSPSAESVLADDYIRPQPRCVRRLEPYNL